MQAFDTSLFSGKRGIVDPILDAFTSYEHFSHYHVTMHPGCTALGEWARYAIRYTERPVLYIHGENEEFLREEELPEGLYSADLNKRKLLVRLDMLPFRYEHGLANYRLPFSEEFMQPYNDLKDKLEMIRDLYRGRNARMLISDPSVLTGARLSIFPQGVTWAQIVQFAARRLGFWHESLDRVNYYSGDNCIENYPDNFSYPHLVDLMKEFGGWFDFLPGNREMQPHASMTCDFTTTAKTPSGQEAMVQSASLSTARPMTGLQEKFTEMVYEAFGVQLAA